MPKSQAAIHEGFHLAGHAEKINRRSQDDALGSKESLGNPPVVVIDPAFPLLHAECASRAVLNVKLGQVYDFQVKTLLGERRPEHLDQLGSIPDPPMGRPVHRNDGRFLVHLCSSLLFDLLLYARIKRNPGFHKEKAMNRRNQGMKWMGTGEKRLWVSQRKLRNLKLQVFESCCAFPNRNCAPGDIMPNRFYAYGVVARLALLAAAAELEGK